MDGRRRRSLDIPCGCRSSRRNESYLELWVGNKDARIRSPTLVFHSDLISLRMATLSYEYRTLTTLRHAQIANTFGSTFAVNIVVLSAENTSYHSHTLQTGAESEMAHDTDFVSQLKMERKSLVTKFLRDQPLTTAHRFVPPTHSENPEPQRAWWASQATSQWLV